jgi:hypothetical protein
MYNDFNVLVLDCLFLILRGIDPNELAKDQQRVGTSGEAQGYFVDILCVSANT